MLILLIVTFEYKRCFSEGDLAEQAEDVTVEVTRFTRGSVVCDFKVTDISPSYNFVTFTFIIFTLFILFMSR